MLDLSDWIWLAVVVIWAVARVVPRIVRAAVKKDGAATPPAVAAPGRPGSRSAEPERLGDVGPAPIEPR